MTISSVRDFVERATACILNTLLMLRVAAVIQAHPEDWPNAFVCFGEVLILVFLLIRRPTQNMSVKPSEWALAYVASYGPTLVVPGGAPLAPDWAVTLLFLIAIGLQVAAKLSLGRSFGIVPANRRVVTSGFYRCVRHPIYATYLLGHIAFLLLNPTLWNATIYAGVWSLQLLRISSEERFLSRDPAYRVYRDFVRYRLIPGVY